MLDRVREALFSMLQPWTEGARALDLFAGSGSLGLEALSRGAERARLVERDPRAAAILADNVRLLGLAERAEVRVQDALAPASWEDGDGAWDLVFFDPPYALLRGGALSRGRLLEALERLAAERLADDGRIVFHAPLREVRETELASLAPERRDYGTSTLWILARP